jgi:hypothetical protein
MIASGLRSRSNRSAGLSGFASGAEFYPYQERTFAAFRRVFHFLGFFSRTATVA